MSVREDVLCGQQANAVREADCPQIGWLYCPLHVQEYPVGLHLFSFTEFEI